MAHIRQAFTQTYVLTKKKITQTFVLIQRAFGLNINYNIARLACKNVITA